MADVVVERMVDRPRLSWGAIFGGAVSALGLWVLLYAFGLAVGLSSLDPANPHSARASGIFTGVWAIIAPLIALFVGGWVAGRGSSIFTRGQGATHGLVVWGLTTLLGASMVALATSAIVGGAFTVGRAAVGAGGSAVGAAASGSGSAARWLGIDANDLLGPVNQRLRAEGKPTVTAQQLEAGTRDVAQTAIRQGRLDRQTLTAAIVQNTGLSRADAEEIANDVQSRYQGVAAQVQSRLREAAGKAETGALKAGDATGKAFWGVFGALALGLIAAVAGGAVGAPGVPGRRLPRERVPRERERVTHERATHPSAIATPREVHP
ncbi:MAG TPA: hypothetical protein VIF57_15130 [Polyangia bacterium]|jgi:hypothetical protein